MKRLLVLSYCIFLFPVFSLDLSTLSGSLYSNASYIGFTDTIPAGLQSDWNSRSGIILRISDISSRGSWFASMAADYVVPGETSTSEGRWSMLVREAWGEVSPADWLSLTLGRFVSVYGTCIAFNPVNPLLSDALFSQGEKPCGFDGVSAEISPLVSLGSLWSLTINGSLLFPGPNLPGEASFEIRESTALVRGVLVVPETGFLGISEVGLSCSFPTLDVLSESTGRSAGFWAGTEIFGLVLGTEFLLRETSFEWAGSVNKRFGDFLFLAEAQYSDEQDTWLGFGRVSRTDENTEAGLSCLWDIQAQSARTVTELSVNTTDSLVFTALVSWNLQPDKWQPAILFDYAAELKMEYFF